MGWFGEICRHEQSFRRFADNRRQAARVISELERFRLGVGEFSSTPASKVNIFKNIKPPYVQEIQVPKSLPPRVEKSEKRNRRDFGYLCASLIGFHGMARPWREYVMRHWDETISLAPDCLGGKARIKTKGKQPEPLIDKIEPRNIIFEVDKMSQKIPA